jgi:hypothetical protein
MFIARLLVVVVVSLCLCGCADLVKDDKILGEHPWQPGTFGAKGD